MGFTITYKVEIEFAPLSGVMIDVSSRLENIVLTKPRTAPGFGGTSGACEIVLQNDPIRTAEIGVMTGVTAAHVGFCPFTPESPTSPWFPNLTDNRRIIITAFWNGGASSKVRFFGWIDNWTPDAGDNPPGSAMVSITGSDILARYAGRRVFSVYGEFAIQNNPVLDYIPFDDAPDSTTVRVVNSSTTPSPSGRVIQPLKPPGSLTIQPPDGGHLTDGQIELNRGDNNTPSPVILLPLRPGATGGIFTFEAAFKLTQDPGGSTGDDAVAGYDINGNLLWTFSAILSGGAITWALCDNTGAQKSFYATGGARDGGWHWLKFVLASSTGTTMSIADKGQSTYRTFGSFAWTYDPRPVTTLVIGGRMNPNLPGKQTQTLFGAISSISLQYGTNQSYVQYGNPGVVTTADAVATRLDLTTTSVDALMGGAMTPSPDTTPYMYPNTTGTLFERWNELVRTVGGGLTVDPSGARRYWRAADMRPLAVSLTLDAEQDLSAPDGGWVGTKIQQPTRVTVTSPLGTFEQIDTVTETATGLRIEGGQIDTAAGSEGVARGLAGIVLSARGTRISSFGVDLTTTSTDKISAVMDLLQNQRIRVSGLPTSYGGVSYLEMFLGGWIETWDAETGSTRFQFDTDPTESYVEGYFDNAEYGRFGMGVGASTVTGGTCIGITGTGTVIVTGTPINNAGGTFTVDLNWNGERITASAAGGATSPQTLTISARGVAPSVARVHVAGEPIEIYHDLTFGP